MSLAVTLSNALSGLAANQSALQVTSNNVANANTEGYARKTVELESRLLDGIGSGVSISGINRAVDRVTARDIGRRPAQSCSSIRTDTGGALPSVATAPSTV